VEPVSRKRLALVASLLAAVLLGGCGLPWPFAQPTPDPKLPDAQQILRPLESGPHGGDVDSLDPGQIQFGFDYGIAQLISPQLVTLDETQQPVDWAAASHEISADGLIYTFHLRKGMTWSDGTPIDATTFAYSINRALDPCLLSVVSNYLFDLAGAATFNAATCPPGAIRSTATLIGSSIQTPDPLTLRLTLAHPAAYFLTTLTWPTSWAVPQTLIERYTSPDPTHMTTSTWTEHLLDNGPFGGNLYLLMSWRHTQTSSTGRGSLVLQRNERYWGKKPVLRRIEYTLYQDVTTAWGDFAQGKGDTASILPAQYAMARALKGITIQQTPALNFSYLRLNWQLAPFDDARVRQAFSLALDRSALALQGFSSTPNIPHGEEQETIKAYRRPTIHLMPEGLPGYNPDLTDAAGRKGNDAPAPDLAMARRLASAYATEKCRGDYSKCPTIFFLMYERATASWRTLFQAMTDQWRQAFPGWAIQFVWIGGTELKTAPPSHLLFESWGADYPDPQGFLSLLWTTHSPYNANSGHVSVPQVDALLSQADGMTDQKARLAVYQLAEQLLVNQGAAIPLYQNVQNDAVRSRVSGWRRAPVGMTLLSVWQTMRLTR
jgi:peptide/nickel transport system substrate-binding protein/oligopeptide transport system substrate-binding protein